MSVGGDVGIGGVGSWVVMVVEHHPYRSGDQVQAGAWAEWAALVVAWLGPKLAAVYFLVLPACPSHRPFSPSGRSRPGSLVAPAHQAWIVSPGHLYAADVAVCPLVASGRGRYSGIPS